jgi:hypothetical protein
VDFEIYKYIYHAKELGGEPFLSIYWVKFLKVALLLDLDFYPSLNLFYC